MMRRASLRASDHDREQVVERLRQAALEGRLRAEEFEHRLARALRAQTYGELDPLLADLPGPSSAMIRRSQLSPAKIAVTGALLVVGAVMAVAVLALAAVVVSAFLSAWALWLVVAWWLMRARHGRSRRYTPRGGRGAYSARGRRMMSPPLSGPRGRRVRPGYWV